MQCFHRILEILWTSDCLPFCLVLCINLVKIHSASLEKGRTEEKEGNNEF